MTRGGGYLWPPRQASGCSGIESSGRDPAPLPGLEQSHLPAVTSTLSRGMHPAALCTTTDRKLFLFLPSRLEIFESNVSKKKLSQKVGAKDIERNHRFQS